MAENSDNERVLNKLEILALNNGWNDKNEKLIVEIGYNCSIYKTLHKETSTYYKRSHKIINITLLVLSVFLTTDSILNVLRDDIVIIIQRIVFFFITIISILNNFLKFAESSEQHLQAANFYNMMYNDIRNTLCIYRKDRINAVSYIKEILKEYDQLEISSPDVKDTFIKKIEKKIKNDDKYKDFIMPNNPLKEIEIAIDQPENTEEKNNFQINNMQNIVQIHDCFKIDGDLSETDNITVSDVNNQKKMLDLQVQYEYNRFLRHN
jgi:hypothetical protein